MRKIAFEKNGETCHQTSLRENQALAAEHCGLRLAEGHLQDVVAQRDKSRAEVVFAKAEKEQARQESEEKLGLVISTTDTLNERKYILDEKEKELTTI